MLAMITGASSGIGRDMARELSRRGYDLILVARRRDRLEILQKELKTKVQIIPCDVSKKESCFSLYHQVEDQDIDVFINNAGFGLFGAFEETDLERELELINTNIRAVHILTKLFLRKFIRRDKGHILNVASSAAFLPGPLLSSYYASKSYVLRLSEAVYEELRRRGSHVRISVLCPGPVRTEFDRVADVRFSVKGLSSEAVARYAIEKMLRGKLIITPGAMMKATRFVERFASEKLLLRCCYHMQKRKQS
ncbi:SDR family NAD(P)-dependent oxidoreductase [Candidatus Soleaferrea massiliensis]|uniref:SDR family NAD(P)-dependent oxidoreductase n=1 Tax=Candidatus Soleaferrea massiliensis TaxID=1470354 RepID=UPI00058E93A3|nr:SDR family oxidoreductase [Candidatus Soleaferrea massiliensis]